MAKKHNKYMKEHAILITGLEFSGKRSILVKLADVEEMTTAPITGLRGESIGFRHANIDTFQLGSRSLMRPMLREYYKDTKAVIFVVDCGRRDRMQDMKYEIQLILTEESLENAVILILANKQDLPDAVSVEEVTQILDLNDVKQEHCNIIGTSTVTGEGLQEAFDWFSTTLTNKNQPTSPDSAKGPKGYLKKLRESLKNAFHC